MGKKVEKTCGVYDVHRVDQRPPFIFIYYIILFVSLIRFFSLSKPLECQHSYRSFSDCTSINRVKNQRGHWVCWMSTSRKNSLNVDTNVVPCRIQDDGRSLHCLLCLLHYNVVTLCRGFVATQLLSL